MFSREIFASRIHALRQDRHATQQDLARLLNITRTQISDLENGKTTTSIERLVLLADYFDVSVDYLIGRSDDPARH